ACRVYAQRWVNVQRDEFKKLGVIMDWDNPYLTMDKRYEASVVYGFGSLVKEGYIERKRKTVAWCPSCQTTLASAEIEYKERKDPSIYVLFPLAQESVQKLFPNLAHQTINMLVWTTTPWTLPLNRALLVNSHGVYQLLDIDGKLVIVGAEVADTIAGLVNGAPRLVHSFTASDLMGAYAQHPFVPKMAVPVILDESVGVTDGTAIVHCAPGAGPLDYEVGVKNGLEIYSPISPMGRYTKDIFPQELEGMPVSQGQGWVIKRLMDEGRLWYKTSINHSYPYCWRCHEALIFRATMQWFFNLEHNGIRDTILQYLNTINFTPPQGKSFLHATVEHRWEWCLSRQRSWGIPIPALLCETCDYSYFTSELIAKVASHIEKEGIEYWDTVQVADLLPEGIVCPKCHTSNFKKETDILDVWFESGMSHFAVLYNNPEQSFPADIYVEGVDQHRGWFQSSLITSAAIEGQPPMKSIMTHGFTVDAKGQKMSKSLGNVVAPDQIIEKLGTDGLRLWVASIGHDGDAIVSETLLRNVSEVYRKIRNTSRFLLQNLYDFDKTHDTVELNKLLLLDRSALAYLYEFQRVVIADYMRGNFTGIFHALADYCSVTLSSFYLDIVKDRLYVEKSDGLLRRSAQTTLWFILDTLTKLMAPILSFTAEQISDYYQKGKQESIHLQTFRHMHDIWHIEAHEAIADTLAGTMDPAYFGQAIKTERVLEEVAFISEHARAWEFLKEIRSA
ncbi:MAG TPA: isoleucine--tRNA ligase, partial [Candidatus Babeliaceae bacterium]|nr:isoleucine--tRNA ligase [Candidatus Babeliaceae bacterium]